MHDMTSAAAPHFGRFLPIARLGLLALALALAACKGGPEGGKGKDGKDEHKLALVKAGSMTKLENGKADTREFDQRMADLTNYLVWMSEPVQTKREQIGYVVLMFLALVMLPLAYLLKKEYWKDVH